MRRSSLLRVGAVGMLGLLISGCVSDPAPTSEHAGSEPVVHEYRTGSLLVQKEKHVTTDEERQRALDAAAQIRAAGAGVGPGGH